MVGRRGRRISCQTGVALALRAGLWAVVEALEARVPQVVREGCWLFAYQHPEACGCAAVRGVARRHQSDCLWQEQRGFLLACSAGPAARRRTLSDLPRDVVLRIVTFFAVWSPEAHAKSLVEARWQPKYRVAQVAQVLW